MALSSETTLARQRVVLKSWIAAAIVGLPSAFLLAFAAIESWQAVGTPFPGFVAWNNGLLVAFHSPDWTGVHAGLRAGDGPILSVDGAPFTTARDLVAKVRALPVGTPVEYVIATSRGEQRVTIQTMTLTVGHHLATFGTYLGAGAIFLLIAVTAAYLQPNRPDARALAIALSCVGALFGLAVDFLLFYRFVPLCQLLEALTPVAGVRLALLFPVERLSATKRTWLTLGLLVLALATAATNASLFYEAPQAARLVSVGIYVASALVLVALLASIAQAVARASRPEDRMKAAVVLSGALVSCLVPAIAIVTFFTLGGDFSFTWIFALLTLFPMSIAYAVLRYDLLEAERFIRLSLGYSGATAAVLLLYATSLLALRALVEPRIAEGPAVAFLFLIILALVFEPARQRVQLGVDRLFFRSSVDSGHILEDSGTELATLADEAAIAGYVERRLQHALALESVAFSSDPAVQAESQIREPVSFRNEKLGVILCGPKLSGAPFSSSERDLVKGMAAQAALALRNARALAELGRAQEALVRNERLAAIGELAGSVAHGIRNPLAGIRAAAQFAREQTGEGTGLRETLDDVLGESDRLEQRVRTLLDFSKPFEPNPQETALGEVLEHVRSAVARQAEQQGVAVDVRVGDGVDRVETDPDFLEEALLELCGNALRYMDAGGTLSLHAETAGGGRTAISVADTGPGIPEGVRGRIFDLFFTTRREGTGMGLASVKKIVDRLGGTIALESPAEGGSRFRIELA